MDTERPIESTAPDSTGPSAPLIVLKIVPRRVSAGLVLKNDPDSLRILKLDSENDKSYIQLKSLDLSTGTPAYENVWNENPNNEDLDSFRAEIQSLFFERILPIAAKELVARADVIDVKTLELAFICDAHKEFIENFKKIVEKIERDIQDLLIGGSSSSGSSTGSGHKLAASNIKLSTLEIISLQCWRPVRSQDNGKELKDLMVIEVFYDYAAICYSKTIRKGDGCLVCDEVISRDLSGERLIDCEEKKTSTDSALLTLEYLRKLQSEVLEITQKRIKSLGLIFIGEYSSNSVIQEFLADRQLHFDPIKLELDGSKCTADLLEIGLWRALRNNDG